MRRRSFPDRSALRVVSPRWSATTSIAVPVQVPSIREPHQPSAENGSGGDRRLTLVLGLLPRADDMTGDACRPDGAEPLFSRRSHDWGQPETQRGVAVGDRGGSGVWPTPVSARAMKRSCSTGFCLSSTNWTMRSERCMSPITVRRIAGPKAQRTENAQAAFRGYSCRRVGVRFSGRSRHPPRGRGDWGDSDESGRCGEVFGCAHRRADESRRRLPRCVGPRPGCCG